MLILSRQRFKKIFCQLSSITIFIRHSSHVQLQLCTECAKLADPIKILLPTKFFSAQKSCKLFNMRNKQTNKKVISNLVISIKKKKIMKSVSADGTFFYDVRQCVYTVAKNTCLFAFPLCYKLQSRLSCPWPAFWDLISKV